MSNAEMTREEALKNMILREDRHLTQAESEYYRLCQEISGYERQLRMECDDVARSHILNSIDAAQAELESVCDMIHEEHKTASPITF